jgi:hypothetical protein
MSDPAGLRDVTTCEVARRARLDCEVVDEVFEQERRLGRLERTATGGWRFTELGWRTIGQAMAGITRTGQPT